MATRREPTKGKALVGDELVQAMVADARLVEETNEAMKRSREGEPGVRWEDVKRRLKTR